MQSPFLLSHKQPGTSPKEQVFSETQSFCGCCSKRRLNVLYANTPGSSLSYKDTRTRTHKDMLSRSLSRPPQACQDLPRSGLLVTTMTSSLFWVSKSCRLREALVTTTPEPSRTLTGSSTIFGGSSFRRCTGPKGTQSKKGNGQGEKTAAPLNEIQAPK